MVIGIIGENCAGKSTLAAALRTRLGGEIVSGNDYLRLAKSPSDAAAVFRKKLAELPEGETVFYVISEPEQIGFLPEDALRILVKAELATVRERFRARMHGVLPPPVEQMLLRKHGQFDSVACDYVYDGDSGDPAALAEKIAGGK